MASKKAETISEAPGIISVITAKDISRMPFESLYDVIKTIPGVNVTESFFGYTSISFRGIKETHYNNRTLLLINGHPIRDVTVGTNWLEAVPANIIERVEIIRGPGSVMYGAGAFTGVINVLTKVDADLAEVTLAGGSKSNMRPYATIGQKKGTFSYIAGVSYKNDKGYVAQAKDEAGSTAQLGGKDGYKDNFYNFFGNFSLQNLKFDVYSFKQNKDKFGIIPNNLTAGEAETQVSGISARYQGKLQGIDVNSQAYFDKSAFNARLNQFPPSPAGYAQDQKYAGMKWGLDVDGRIGLADNVSLLSGVSYENQDTDPYEFLNSNTGAVTSFAAFLKHYNTNDLSLFSQMDVSYGLLRLLGGVRYNKNNIYGDTYVPRASLVFKASDKVFIKALYGSAYRNPTFFEKYVNTQNVLYGCPDLKPEKINSVELGADWMLKSNAVRFALFNLSTDDMIGRVRTYNPGDVPDVTMLEQRNVSTTPTAATPGYGNTTGEIIQGVELDLKGELLPRTLSYSFNVSYKDGKEKADDSAIQYLDKVGGNLGLTYAVKKLENTVMLNYVGERVGTISAGKAATGFATGQEIRVPAYSLVNLKSTYEINSALSVSLIVMNLFEQGYGYPEYIRRIVDTIPGDAGRNIFGELSYKF
ncbi:MAG: TonB-dependent receptor plug domain-containing protein [Endomicrobiales bacterium]